MTNWFENPKTIMIAIVVVVTLGTLLGFVAPQGGLYLGRILDPNNLHGPCLCREETR